MALPVIVYFLTLSLQYSLPVWYGSQSGYQYFDGISFCSFYVGVVFGDGTIIFWAFLYWEFFINTLLPLPLIIISSGITFYKLTKVSEVNSNSHGRRGTKRDATITIIILTMIYIVFNLPLCVWWMVSINDTTWEYMGNLLGNRHFDTVDKSLNFVSVGINSMLNQVAYFCRIRGYRHHVQNLGRNARSSFATSKFLNSAVAVERRMSRRDTNLIDEDQIRVVAIAANAKLQNVENVEDQNVQVETCKGSHEDIVLIDQHSL